MSWQYPPQIVQWDITPRCNLRCRHCRAANLNSITEDLALDEIIFLLDKINRLSPDASLALAGGEPLVRQDLKEIISYIKRHLQGISIELLTNGTLIDKENTEWLVEAIHGFNISLEGATPEINDRIRGQGAFHKTITGIKLLLERNAQVAVRMTYFHQGEDEVEKLMRFTAELGVSFFNFRYLVPVGRASQKKIDAKQYHRLCQRIWSLRKDLGMTVGFSDPFPEILIDKEEAKKVKSDLPLLKGEAVSGCSIAFTLLYLNPQGIVQLCPYFPVTVADAKKEDLRQIWFKNELLDCFRGHRSLLKGKCGDCEYKFACGGCRGAALANGDFLGEDPRCWKK